MVLEKKNVVFFCRLFFVICGLFLFCLEHFKGLTDTLYAIFEKKKRCYKLNEYFLETNQFIFEANNKQRL